MKNYHRVVTIAGSDSGGGAGIQADLKAISANGCYAATIVTALTAQNTLGVSAIHPVPIDFVAAQMDAVLGDIGADCIKIGMLFSVELIATVAEGLIRHGIDQIVLDPVMVATSGDRLLEDEAVAALKELLIPRATLITPNLPEASVLLQRQIETSQELDQAARHLCASLGCANALVKGGHLKEEESLDLLYLGQEKRAVSFPQERIPTTNTHGTGCSLSSAIAAHLARGCSLVEAVTKGKRYLTGAIRSGAEFRLGSGHGPVDHFFMLPREPDQRA
jgi:hydroxymethylpyrimidine/phosphomethylpyrimidine kinase